MRYPALCIALGTSRFRSYFDSAFDRLQYLPHELAQAPKFNCDMSSSDWCSGSRWRSSFGECMYVRQKEWNLRGFWRNKLCKHAEGYFDNLISEFLLFPTISIKYFLFIEVLETEDNKWDLVSMNAIKKVYSNRHNWSPRVSCISCHHE